jgi:hypothetical protein
MRAQASGLALSRSRRVGRRCARRAFLVDRPGHRGLDGELLVGEATAHLAGWGTIALRSLSNPGLTCAGEFSATDARGDAGQLRCSNGATAAFQFHRLSLRRGYGAGTSGSALSFTYGLTAEESAPYLKLPYGKALGGDGSNLALGAAVPIPPR